MLLSDFLRKLSLNFYIMNNAKIKVIMIFLCNRNQNLIETALILLHIFPIVKMLSICVFRYDNLSSSFLIFEFCAFCNQPFFFLPQKHQDTNEE